MTITALTLACASSPRCPERAVCGAGSWRGTAIDGPMRVVALTDVDDGTGGARAGWIAVTPRGTRMTFDLGELPPGTLVERAILSVRERPGARRGAVTLRARALLTRWGEGDDPPRSAGAGSVRLAPDARGPVRIDVTDALREAFRWGAGRGGFSLETDGGEVRLAGPWDLAGAPRLEVATR